jgi:hypothetical protein
MRNQTKRDESHDLSLKVIQVSTLGIIIVLLIINILNKLM